MYFDLKYFNLPFQIQQNHIRQPAEFWAGIFIFVKACVAWDKYIVSTAFQVKNMSMKHFYREAGLIAAAFYSIIHYLTVCVPGSNNTAA
jgi:hypothetical protein